MLKRPAATSMGRPVRQATRPAGAYVRGAAAFCVVVCAISPRSKGGEHAAGASAADAAPRASQLCLRGGCAEGSCAEWRAEGQMLLAAGETMGALHAFQKAVDVLPSDADSLTALGRLLDRVHGDQQEAFNHFVRAVRAAPDNPVALSNYAFGLENWCDRALLAEDAYWRAQALDPGNVPVLVNLASLLEQPLTARDHRYGENAEAQRQRQAAQLYTRALALEPTNRNALCNFAGMLMTYGDGDDSDVNEQPRLQRGGARASELLARALALHPSDTAVLINYGVLMEDWGDNLVLASQIYQKAVDIEPDNSVAVCSLARTLRVLKRFPEAAAVARSALKLFPADSRDAAVLDIDRELWRAQQMMLEADGGAGGGPGGGVNSGAHPRIARDLAAGEEEGDGAPEAGPRVDESDDVSAAAAEGPDVALPRRAVARVVAGRGRGGRRARSSAGGGSGQSPQGREAQDVGSESEGVERDSRQAAGGVRERLVELHGAARVEDANGMPGGVEGACVDASTPETHPAAGGEQEEAGAVDAHMSYFQEDESRDLDAPD